MSSGVAGKWQALEESRDALRAELDEIRRELKAIQMEKDADEKRNAGLEMFEKSGVNLDDSEKEVMDAILFGFNRITREWRLKSNISELTSAVHVMQSFVAQHMLSRLAPDQWGSWWE